MQEPRKAPLAGWHAPLHRALANVCGGGKSPWLRSCPFRKPRRLTPEIVGELLRIHSSCVHDQEGKCGLLISR